MKKLLIGLFVLGNFSSFANDCNFAIEFAIQDAKTYAVSLNDYQRDKSHHTNDSFMTPSRLQALKLKADESEEQAKKECSKQ